MAEEEEEEVSTAASLSSTLMATTSSPSCSSLGRRQRRRRTTAPTAFRSCSFLLLLALLAGQGGCIDTPGAGGGGSGSGGDAAGYGGYYAGGSSAGGGATATKPKFKTHRKRNLDYLDADTMTYYLTLPEVVEQAKKKQNDSVGDDGAGGYLQDVEDALVPKYDVAVLFYASWDQNSIRLAGTWDKIATLLKAGTNVDSKLIVGLFDCEYDYSHVEACTKAGITHYPTILYFSMGGGSVHRKPPKHATKFKGNWQYGEALLDWLKTMRGLSQWHRAGWGSRLRSMFFRRPDMKKKKQQLPVGIPGSAALLGSPTGAVAGSAAGSGGATAASSQFDELKLKKAEEEAKKMKDLAVRSSVMIESLLFPRTMPMSTPPTEIEMLVGTSNNGKNYTDVYHLLNTTDGWASSTNSAVILRSCAQDIALDYCDRFKIVATEDYLREEQSKALAGQIDWTKLKAGLQAELERQEPYCLVLEDCVLTQFAADQCRPKTCPFKDPAACRYMTSCFSESLQRDYANALGISYSKPGGGGATTASGGAATAAGDAATAAGTGAKNEAAKKEGGGGGGFWGRK